MKLVLGVILLLILSGCLGIEEIRNRKEFCPDYMEKSGGFDSVSTYCDGKEFVCNSEKCNYIIDYKQLEE